MEADNKKHEMDRERFKALCALYFFNTIQPDELKELKSALDSGDRELQEIFYQTKKSIDKMSLSVDIIDHSSNINNNIHSNPKAKKKKKIDFPFKKYYPETTAIKNSLTAAISILLFLSILILTFYLYQFSSENSSLNNKLMDDNNLLNYNRTILNVLESKQIDVIKLSGQNINPGGYGKLFWSPSSNEAVLQVANLPTLNAYEDYQLWLTVKDSAISEGVINVNRGNQGNFYYIKNMPLNNDDAGYSILLTLEQKGGANKPSGTIFLKGDVNIQ